MSGLHIPDEYIVPITNVLDGGWEAVAVQDVASVVAAELRRLADEMDPATSLPSDARLANRTRQLWADSLRMRAAELEGERS